jgi:hypothetical protein
MKGRKWVVVPAVVAMVFGASIANAAVRGALTHVFHSHHTSTPALSPEPSPTVTDGQDEQGTSNDQTDQTGQNDQGNQNDSTDQSGQSGQDEQGTSNDQSDSQNDQSDSQGDQGNSGDQGSQGGN